MGFHATNHALERFRERVDCRYADLRHDDLEALLSERLTNETLVRREVRDRRSTHPTALHLLSRADGFEYVCVVRVSTVVTILDTWMAGRNFPGWRDAVTA